MTLTFNLLAYNFFHKESKSYKKKKKKKKKNIFLFGGRGGRAEVGGGRGRWMDRRTGPNQFASSTSSKLGALQCINEQVMSLTSSIYNHFII